MNKNKNKKPVFYTYLYIIFCAVIAASTVRFFLVESYRIPTSLMAPTMLPGDLIFVNKAAYDFRIPFLKQNASLPHYGDVVIYSSQSESDLLFIKRVVGLPGDTISVRDGKLELNEHPIEFEEQDSESCGIEKHPQKNYSICLEPPLITFEESIRVKEGEIFVITDKRTTQTERPMWEIIHPAQLLGKASLVWLSIDPETPFLGFFPQLRLERSFKKVN